MPLETGSTLADRYQLEREIGSGGMATVYAARDTRHDRSVAVKVLRPELASSIGGERFLREIAIVARLQHPHIVGLIDSGMADELPYYVMPLIYGKSLRDRLSEEGELPLGRLGRHPLARVCLHERHATLLAQFGQRDADGTGSAIGQSRGDG